MKAYEESYLRFAADVLCASYLDWNPSRNIDLELWIITFVEKELAVRHISFTTSCAEKEKEELYDKMRQTVVG